MANDIVSNQGKVAQACIAETVQVSKFMLANAGSELVRIGDAVKAAGGEGVKIQPVAFTYDPNIEINDRQTGGKKKASFLAIIDIKGKGYKTTNESLINRINEVLRIFGGMEGLIAEKGYLIIKVNAKFDGASSTGEVKYVVSVSQ